MKKKRVIHEVDKQFGFRGEGWDDKEDLSDFSDWCHDVDKAIYDIRNCCRGAYCKDIGDDMPTLIKHLEFLRDEFDSIIVDLKIECKLA